MTIGIACGQVMQLDDSDSENGHEGWLLLYEAARLAIANKFAFVLSD